MFLIKTKRGRIIPLLLLQEIVGTKLSGRFLPLGQIVRSDSLLEEFQATLLLANSEQLLGSPLIGGKANHFSDEISHKLVVLGQLPLGLAGLGLQGVLGGLVTFLQ